MRPPYARQFLLLPVLPRAPLSVLRWACSSRIDVLDETGARVRLDSICIPQDLKDMEEELAETKRQLDDAVANLYFRRSVGTRLSADFPGRTVVPHQPVVRSVTSR